MAKFHVILGRFSVLAKRLAEKRISSMLYLVLSEMLNLTGNSINQSLCLTLNNHCNYLYVIRIAVSRRNGS